jgi:hypothetical protein
MKIKLMGNLWDVIDQSHIVFSATSLEEYGITEPLCFTLKLDRGHWTTESEVFYGYYCIF